MTNTFRKMTDAKVIHRADGEKIGYFDIHIELGFNPAGRTDGANDEDDDQLYEFIVANGIFALPAWEVRPRDEGGVWAVDCHRRHKQFGRAIADGKITPDPKTGKYLVPIKQFIGNDVDRIFRIYTSSRKKDLQPLQFAELCKRLTGHGLTPEEIAVGFFVSRSKVDAALVLVTANRDVQLHVAAGAIAVTEAVKVVKKAGDKAGAAIAEAVQKARLDGKTKATARHIEGNTRSDLVKAIRAEMESGGKFRAETLAPRFAAEIGYLRGTAKDAMEAAA